MDSLCSELSRPTGTLASVECAWRSDSYATCARCGVGAAHLAHLAGVTGSFYGRLRRDIDGHVVFRR